MVQFAVPPSPEYMKFKISEFAGSNLDPDMSRIEDNESPNMWNMDIDDQGILDKRTGYMPVLENSLGPGKVNGIIKYKDKVVIGHGTKLYLWDFENEPVELYNNITDTRINGFSFTGKLYIINGYEYLVYDGNEVKEVTPSIPTIMVSTTPEGGGEKLDDFNLLGSGFSQLFSADGEATVFKLIIDELDPTLIKIDITTPNGIVTLEEGRDFTVDRAKGLVDFSKGTSPYNAPIKGVNNVKITAYKTIANNKEKVLRCTMCNIYGGQNDTRVHFTGNPDYPEIVRRCGLNDPAYFPENDFDKFTTDGSPVLGFANYYTNSIILKEDSLWTEGFYLDNGTPTFTTKPLNRVIGIKGPNTVQILDNTPTFASHDGVRVILSSDIPDERNSQLISEKINRDLLKRNIKDAVSCEYMNKYLLAFPDGVVWVYNYLAQIWYPWDSIYASCFFVRDNLLYFGSSEDGMIYRFKTREDVRPFNDNGKAIKAIWDSKVIEFDYEEFMKMTKHINFALRPGRNNCVDVYYATDKKHWQHLMTQRANLFSYDTLDYSLFTYAASLYPHPVGKKLKTKRIVYFQLRFVNNNNNENMGIMFFSIKYRLQREVK